MESDDYVGRYGFEVEPFQEDYTGRLSWGVLGNLLLRCASLHSAHYGFGYNRAEEDAYAWVLSRLVIELDEMPRTGEQFTVETWVGRIYRLFSDRPYAVRAADGRVLGYALSVWALIDKATRRPVDLEQMADPEFRRSLVGDRPCPVQPPRRIRVKAAAPTATYTARYTDIDINGHFNSIRYLELVLNLFPKERYATHRVARVEMAYSSETYCGETLSLYCEEVATGQFAVEIRKNADTQPQVAVRADITFKPYEQE